MKRSAMGPVIVVLAILLSSSTSASPPPPRYEFLVASFEESLGYRFWDSAVDRLVYVFALCDGLQSYELHMDFDEEDVGVPLWWTPKDTNFLTIITGLANGTPNPLYRMVFERVTGNGSGTPQQTELEVFGQQVGPNGVDLGGFKINRIGVVFDTIIIRPDYDTHSTTWQVHGQVRFTQQASKLACMKDGWKWVRRLDGAPFQNQGDCIQYAQTGK